MARPKPETFDKHKTVAENRRARFDYSIADKFEAGLMLQGTEVKALRAGEASIAESYAEVRGEEVWLVNANIPEFSHGNRFNHEPKRPRKLLLHGREIDKMRNAVSRDAVLGHLAELVAATGVPINADFEGGFADDPAGVATNVRLAAATGVAGISIEDSTGRAESPLYPIGLAAERVRAARAALDVTAPDVMLVGRAECYFVGHRGLDETIARLRAYSAAGADCLYAPGLSTREEIAAVVAAVAPKPVNVVMLKPIGLAVADLAALGVRRISLGSALARAAWGELERSAREILDRGTFDLLGRAMPSATLNGLFRSRP